MYEYQCKCGVTSYSAAEDSKYGCPSCGNIHARTVQAAVTKPDEVPNVATNIFNLAVGMMLTSIRKDSE